MYDKIHYKLKKKIKIKKKEKKRKAGWTPESGRSLKGMVTHSSILGWRIPWTDEVWQATIHGVPESDMTEVT